MKLEYDSVTLGDDAAGDFITDHGGAHGRVIQQDPLFGGSAPFTRGRGNHSNQRSFTVNKLHANLAAAVEWFNQHPDELADNGSLVITQTTANTMADATLESVDRVELTGVSTVLRYNFTGGRIV